MLRRLPALLLAVAPVASATPPAADDADALVYQGIEARLRSVISETRDVTYTLHRTEWVRGAMTAPEHIAIKLRAPLDLYLTWTGETYPGREVLYREGHNDGKMTVNAGRALVPTLSLDPLGSLAMRNSRHPVYDASLFRTVDKILRGGERVAAAADFGPQITDLGIEDVQGAPAHCFRTKTPKDRDPDFYAYEQVLCFDEATGLPSRVSATDLADGALREVERYEFGDLRPNAGLDDADFDVDNEHYDF